MINKCICTIAHNIYHINTKYKQGTVANICYIYNTYISINFSIVILSAFSSHFLICLYPTFPAIASNNMERWQYDNKGKYIAACYAATAEYIFMKSKDKRRILSLTRRSTPHNCAQSFHKGVIQYAGLNNRVRETDFCGL